MSHHPCQSNLIIPNWRRQLKDTRKNHNKIPISMSQCVMVAGLTGLLEKLMETSWEKLIRLKKILCTLAFFISEFGILIDPRIVNEPGKNIVDIHAMGTEANSGFPWHLVIDYDAGVKFDEKGFVGRDINYFERVSCKRFQLKLPHYIDGCKERDYTVDIITLIEDSNVTKQAEGSRVVPEENWDEIVFFKIKDNKVEGAHVTLIVGKYREYEICSLLLRRFWNCIKAPKINVVNELLSEAIAMTKNENIECCRRGGSSGIFNVESKALTYLLRVSAISPRKPRGNFVVPSSGGSKVILAYINFAGYAKS